MMLFKIVFHIYIYIYIEREREMLIPEPLVRVIGVGQLLGLLESSFCDPAGPGPPFVDNLLTTYVTWRRRVFRNICKRCSPVNLLRLFQVVPFVLLVESCLVKWRCAILFES